MQYSVLSILFQLPAAQMPTIQPPTISAPNVQSPNIQPDESWLQYWPIAAIIVGSLILLVGLYLLFLLWKARRKKAALESAERRAAGVAAMQERSRREADKRVAARMRQSFKEAVSKLKAGVSGRNYRYQIPWFLMVGENDSGKSTLLDNSGLAMPLGRIGGQSDVKSVCDWYFYSDGLMINVNGNAFVQSDGSIAGRRIWKHILRQLTKCRPERPIDGIVLTIPATDLLAPLNESHERIYAKADAIYQRLVEAQKETGLCFPVYVVISKCDQITGFREFGASLPERFREQIFGWSSPYTLETAFNSRWVDEAINGMDSHIYEMQSETFAENDYLAGRDEMFLFPAEFQKIAEPLKEFMSGVFKQSVYHETIFLRGIYFTGSVDGISLIPQEAVATSDMGSDEETLDMIGETSEKSTVNPQAKPLFLRGLLEKKVFPEWQIARPASRIALHQNRTIRAIQIGLAVMITGWSLWLWLGYDNLLEKREVLLPFLEVLKATDADEVKFTRHAADGTFMIDTVRMRETIRNNQLQFKGQSTNLRNGVNFNPTVIDKFVQYANNTDAAEIWSFGNPASWPLFTRLHSDITECMRLKYRKFILDVFREKLRYVATNITSEKESAGSISEGAPNIRLEQMQEFEKLITYGNKLNLLGKKIDDYNGLAAGGKGDLDKVRSLMEYLFNMSPSEGFKNSISDYFNQAVNQAKGDQISSHDYQAPATRKFERMADALSYRMIHQNPINSSLDEMQRYMTLLVRFDPALNNNEDGSEEYGGLVDKLNESIEGLQRNLDRPEFAWVFDSTPRPLSGIFTIMKNSMLVSAEKVDMVERKFEDELQTFQSSVITRRADYFESPLLTKKEGRYYVSDEVIAVKKALATLLGKEFMRVKLSRESRLADRDILWNIDGLAESSRLLNENFEFIGKTIPALENIKTDLRQSLAKVARFQVELDVRKQISDAQNGYPSQGSEETTVAKQIQHVNEVRGVISTLLSALRSHDLNIAAGQLARSIAGQMNYLLQRQWAFLDKSGRYDVSQPALKGWEGEQNLSKALFSADNMDALVENMKIWRSDIAASAVRDVQPLLSFLQSSAVNGQSANTNLTSEGRKFQAIAEQLDKYEKKIPGNSVQALENFLLQYLDSIKYYSDYKRYTKDTRGVSVADDYFSDRLAKMKKNIRERCETIVSVKASEYCNEAAKFFGNPDKLTRHARLTNHFPFVQNPARYDGAADEARPDDIREFYSKFGPRLEFVHKWLALDAKNSYYDESVDEARRFIREMMDLQQSFRSYLQSDRPDAAPAFDLLFDYRIKFSDERGSQDIVEWKVQSGDNTVTNRNPSQRLRWEWGTPITVSLRWANNGDVVPVKPDSSDGILRVDSRSAIFEFGNKWSLIQMMKAKEPPLSDADEDNSDAYNWFLKFDVKTKNIARREDGNTRVYVRLRLFTPGGKEPVPINAFINLPYKANKLEAKRAD